MAIIGAIQAQNTLWRGGQDSIRLFLLEIFDLDIHRAFLDTEAAIGTGALGVLDTETGEPVEKGQDRSDGTEDLAEDPGAEYRPDQDGQQHQKAWEPRHQGCDIPLGDRTRQQGFQATSRAELAEEGIVIGTPHSWNQNDSDDQQDILDAGHPAGGLPFGRRDEVKEVLQESEGADPAAQDPAEDGSQDSDGAQDQQGSQTPQGKMG